MAPAASGPCRFHRSRASEIVRGGETAGVTGLPSSDRPGSVERHEARSRHARMKIRGIRGKRIGEPLESPPALRATFDVESRTQIRLPRSQLSLASGALSCPIVNPLPDRTTA